MKMTKTGIPDVVVIEPVCFADDRGWFMESFNERRFRDGLAELGLPEPSGFVQDNHSLSRKGVLRGLHYQMPPYAQGKLVRVVRGAVVDVAVDIRRGSPTFGGWVMEELTAENRRMLWIPAGFAHGFMALEDGTEFLYKTTGYYAKESERCIAWDDADLAIRWPSGFAPIVSVKDAEGCLLSQAETY